MSHERIVTSSVAQRLRISEGRSATWLVLVPEGSERTVALELHDEISRQGSSAFVWPGQEPESDAIALIVLSGSAIDRVPTELDGLRSMLAADVVAFVVAEPRGDDFMTAAPHVAGFVAGHVVFTSAEDDETPPDYVARRLASLREAYGMTDDQARKAFESGRFARDAHFLEWMILLGDVPDSGG